MRNSIVGIKLNRILTPLLLICFGSQMSLGPLLVKIYEGLLEALPLRNILQLFFTDETYYFSGGHLWIVINLGPSRFLGPAFVVGMTLVFFGCLILLEKLPTSL